MFTERFLKVPCIVYNTYEEEITGKHGKDCEMISVIKKINPTRIESYGEAVPLRDFSKENKIWTTVCMQSGDEFIVRIPIAEFEKILNEHQKT
jgi:hypothetical protein